LRKRQKLDMPSTEWGCVIKTFVKSVAVITIFAVVTRAIGFLFRIFLSRILGAEMLGVYQLAMSFFLVFLTLVASGLPLAISKQVASKNSQNQTRDIIFAGLVISLITSFIACFVVFAFGNLFTPLFGDGRCVAILIALIPSTIAACVYGTLRAVWWGEKRFFLLGITELMEQTVRVVVFVIMLAFAFYFVDMAQIAALSYTVAFAIAAVTVAVIFAKTRLLVKNPAQKSSPKSQFKPLLKSALPITGVRMVTSLTVPIISVLIIKRLVECGWDNTAAIAAFGILMGMTMPMLSIPQTVISSLSTALVPELSAAAADKRAVGSQIDNALKFTIFVNFILIPVYIALGAGIGQFVFANVQSGLYLSQFAWAMIPLSLSQITNAILNSLGAETRAMKHYFIGSVFLFAAIWFLPKYFGIASLVLGIGACMAVASTLNLLLINKIAGTKVAKNTIKMLLNFTAIAAPAALFGFFLFGVIINLVGLFTTLMVCTALVFAAFLILCHLFKIVTFDTIYQGLKK
jgi:stage V sporulation protein B